MPTWEGTLAPPGECNSTCASVGPPKSTTQTANRSVWPFLHSSRQCRRVHWHHLANTTEPSICSGNAVLCQITLTTCCCSCCCCFVSASVDWLYVDFLQLALIQTNSVISRLQSFFPSLKFEVGKVSCKINYLIYIVCVR